MSDIKLFRLQAGQATELQGDASDLEKPLQTLIEKNLDTLLRIRFLASEYATGKTHGGRIDSLGLDENDCPVILEYKRSVGENVINQGLFYLDWLMDHQAEFKLLVMETLGKTAADQIDWSAPRLVCIAADFTKPDSSQSAARPNLALATRRGSGEVEQQLREQRAKVKPMVEAPSEGSEVAGRVFAEGKVLVRTVDGRLEVGQDRVDPLEARQLARFARAHDDVGVCAARVDDAAEAAQPVAEHIGAWHQRGACPVGNGLRGEGRYWCNLGVHRHSLRVDLHRRHERHLVRRATTARAGVLAAQVGVIDNNAVLQRQLRVGLGHHAHDLVVYEPGRAVAHPQVAHQRQRGQTCLGLAKQVHREKPHAQRQLGAVEHGACRQRGLVPTRAALQHSTPSVGDAVRLTRRAARAGEAAGPALTLQRVDAKRLGAVSRRELRKRQAALELNGVAGHGDLHKLDGGTLRFDRLMG